MKAEFNIMEAVCYELLPYSVPILYFLILRRIYRIPWHWENENDPPEERVQIADEILTVLSKDGHTATFTDAEFEELQAGAKEAIEGKFFKKVLEQQKK